MGGDVGVAPLSKDAWRAQIAVDLFEHNQATGDLMLVAAAQTEHQPRKRGRPVGAITHDIEAPLGLQHFAFLRAWLEGVPLQAAWTQYLGYQGTRIDERLIKSHTNQLYSLVLVRAMAIPGMEVNACVQTLLERPTPRPLNLYPSIDEFCRERDLDIGDYSEQEIIDMIKAEYQHTEDSGQLSATSWPDKAATGAGEHVQALNRLIPYLAAPVLASDRLSRWLARQTCQRIRHAEQWGGQLDTVGDLVRHINHAGSRWFARMPGLGKTRASRIEVWLRNHEESTGLTIAPGSICLVAPHAKHAPAEVDIAPLERLKVPSHLDGSIGTFRSVQPNTLGASTDLEAIEAWLRSYPNANTYDAFKREVERYYLWCLCVLRKPLTSISADDCNAYRAFLTAPGAGWTTHRPVPRNSSAWRPFRKPLSDSSAAMAISIVNTLYAALVSAGYTSANPMASIARRKRGADARTRASVSRRSFDEKTWKWIRAKAMAQSGTARGRRLLLALDLFVGTGLRLNEAATARIKNLERISFQVAGGQQERDAWILNVVGKGNKPRQVPVPEDVAHRLIQQAKEAYGAFWLGAPLLADQSHPHSRLNPERAEKQQGGRPVSADHPGLGAAGIYHMFKRFFRRIAGHAAAEGIDRDSLYHASTHWLRHTFGRQFVGDGGPLDVAKEILGHASLNTTSIYTTATRDRMLSSMLDRQRGGQND